MSRLGLFLAIAVSVNSHWMMTAAKAETLPEVVGRVLKTNPTVGAALFDAKAKTSAVSVAKSLWKPRVNVSAQAGGTRTGSQSGTNYGANLSLVQPLYDGGEASSTILKSRAELGASRRRYEDSVLATCLLTIQTYIEVQRSRQVQDIARKNLASLVEINNVVRQRSEAGFGSDAEIFQAASGLANGREQYVSAQQQRNDAAGDFESLTGAAPGKLETIGAPNSALPATAGESVVLAMKHSPKLAAATYDAWAARASYDVTKSAGAPKVNFNMGVNYDDTDGSSSSHTLSSSAQVVFKLNLYDGGEQQGRKRQASYLAQQTYQNILREKQSVEHDVRRNWNAIVAAPSKLASLSARAAAAQKSFRLNLQRFKAGKTDINALLNLQAEKVASDIAYVNELATSRYNTFRLLAATGRLLEALKLNQPQDVSLQ